MDHHRKATDFLFINIKLLSLWSQDLSNNNYKIIDTRIAVAKKVLNYNPKDRTFARVPKREVNKR